MTVRRFVIFLENQGQNTLIRNNADTTNYRRLQAGVTKVDMVPSQANMVLINSSSDVYVKIGTSYAEVSGLSLQNDIVDGSAPELNPEGFFMLDAERYLGLISETDAKVTLTYYRQY